MKDKITIEQNALADLLLSESNGTIIISHEHSRSIASSVLIEPGNALKVACALISMNGEREEDKKANYERIRNILYQNQIMFEEDFIKWLQDNYHIIPKAKLLK